MSNNIFCVEDARRSAKTRMPKIMFDFIEGGAGTEMTCRENIGLIEKIKLQPRTLINIENRVLKKTLFDREWGLPFGIAPMGMCNLTWPDADRMLGKAATKHNIPIGLSTMASSTIEEMRQWSGECAWFQLYVGQSEEIAFDMVQRAENAEYETLVFTVDVPLPAARLREQRNGFQAPLKIGPKQFFDFATHPRWSLTTLLNGIPDVANNRGGKTFVRNESRGKVDWAFLDRLRARWKGTLVVKGVLSVEDAVRISESGVDGVWISNHGGRQLGCAPATIEVLPRIRAAVGTSYPIIFDSGVRDGEAVIKALALGADFVMLGRPFLYGIGAAGSDGLNTIIEVLRKQIDTTLAQLGKPNINDIDHSVIFAPNFSGDN